MFKMKQQWKNRYEKFVNKRKRQDFARTQKKSFDILLKKAFNSPTGFNTPIDVTIMIQQLCDHGDFIEIQITRIESTYLRLLLRLVDLFVFLALLDLCLATFISRAKFFTTD